MNRTIVHLTAVVTLMLLVSACQPVRRFPDYPVGQPPKAVPVTQGWMLAGTNPDMYEFFMDGETMRNGQFSGTLKSVPNSHGNTGASASQYIRADEYRGKRLRYTGWLKTEDVSSLSALWMRVDAEDGWPVAFDNMYERQATVTGDSDWTRYAIVLDVPENAREILFGINMGGIGQTWFDDLQLEVVGEDVAVTMAGISEQMRKDIEEYWKMQGEAAWQAKEAEVKARIATSPTQPVNLDFEAE